MATLQGVRRNGSLRWRLWAAAAVFPAVTIALPAYVVWVWLLPILLEWMGPGGAASGSWVAWALLAIGVVSSGTFVGCGADDVVADYTVGLAVRAPGRGRRRSAGGS